jgi:outer membrane protein OmpA-like peptidoglycan-associated protein
MLKRLMMAVVLVVAASCADLSKFTKDSGDLVSAFAPQVDGMLKGGMALKDRAMALPAELPGASDLVAKITGNQASLEKLKSDVSGYSGKIDEAVKAGDGNLVSQLFDQQKAASTNGLASAGKMMDGLKGELSGLESKATAMAEEKAKAASMAVKPVEMAKPSMFSKTLPGGFALTGNPTGIEAQLVGFVDDAGKAVDKTTWFNFDRLTFKTGSSELEMDKSKEQLTNMVEILKAYPKLKLKVGGYTDNQGKADANKKLSTARATTVAKAILGMGIKADRLDPEGYGDQHPVCAANDTEECRAQNRRIAVRVTSK